VTVGNFDGAHRGHAVLVQTLRTTRRPAVVVTFDPHPLALLRPEAMPPLLTTPYDRAQLLHDLGADHVLLLRTTPELLQLDAQAFFRGLMLERLAARAVVEGPNFRFGRNREGDNERLAQWCRVANIPFETVALQQIDGVEVSSSLIRRALQEGRIPQANAALGRPYVLRGVVGTGAQRGRTLGFPTANLEQVQTLIPAEGVYAARVLGHAAAVHIGPNPTFGEGAKKIEAHLIDFDGDLYGKEISIAFLAWLRPIRRFGSAEELRLQLQHDIATARKEALG
jgi:riboflavin kinase/FMN adenylyltransferase